MPIVTVIVPNYNHAKYLEKRIESILLQYFQDFELIILDDCSTDNSSQVIELYRNHPKVTQIVYNECNSGNTFNQWSKGISFAKGDFIWIAESDDWAEPEFLEKLFTKFLEDKDLGLVYCDSNIYVNDVFTQKYSDTKTISLHNSKWNKDYINGGTYELNDSLLFNCTINNVSAVLFKKDVIEKAKPFDIKFKFIGDWYCYIKIASLSKIGYINKPLNNYREHSNNTFNKVFHDLNYMREYFLLFNWIFKHIQINDKNKALIAFRGYMAHKFFPVNTKILKTYYELFTVNKKLFFNLLYAKVSNRFRLIINKAIR